MISRKQGGKEKEKEKDLFVLASGKQKLVKGEFAALSFSLSISMVYNVQKQVNP